MSALLRRPPAGVFAGVLLISLALLPAANYSIDGDSMLAVSRSLALDQSLTVSCDVGYPGRGGDCYSNWYPLLSVLMVPFVLIGHVVAAAAGVRAAAGEEAVALVVPALATAGAAALTTALARSMGASVRASVLAACTFAFATETLCYTRTLFAETLGAFVVTLTVWGFVGDGRRRRLVGLPAIVLVVLTKPQLLLVGPAVGLAVAVSRRKVVPLAEALAATFAGGALFLLYNLLRFESLTDFGGASRTVSLASGGDAPSWLERVGLLTISPRQGLFLFSPVVAVGVVLLWRHRRDSVVLACAGGALAVFAVYLSMPYGNAWGTRYLVPLLPLVCAPLALARGRTARVAVALAAVGFVIQLPTTVAYYQRYYRDSPSKSLQTWSVSNSQLWRIWPAAYRELRDASRSDLAAVINADAGGTSRSDTLVSTVALWFWVLPVAGIPWPAGLFVALLLIGAGVRVLVRTSRGPPARPAAASQLE